MKGNRPDTFTGRNLKAEVDVRWNSAFDSWERMIDMRQAVTNLQVSAQHGAAYPPTCASPTATSSPCRTSSTSSGQARL